MSHAVTTVPPNIPLVVQIGFAGSRRLLDAAAHPGVDVRKFHSAVEEHMRGVLRELPRVLGLSPKHFLCGVSQIAIGADTVFTRACAAEGIRQRIFLPQHRDEYFKASEPDGTGDFTAQEAAEAKRLIESEHIIEDRTVSQSAVRSERFEDVNLDLVRVSDVLIALQRANPNAKAGGTCDFILRAASRHRPLLEITVSVQDGRPAFTQQWHPNHRPDAAKDAPLLEPPRIPSVLEKCSGAEGTNCAEAVKKFASAQAKQHQWRFILAALVIIGTHFLATLCAALGLSFPVQMKAAMPWLLGVELALLATGLGHHLWLHNSDAAKQWAIARLVSEVARSVTQMAKVPGYLGHLFTLPLPEMLRPLLRTLNVFHLEATRDLDPTKWKTRRDSYLHERLTKPVHGQIAYYAEQQRRARRWLRVANTAFYTGSALAFIATSTELFCATACRSLGKSCALLEWLARHGEYIEHGPGFLAIILPVLSVAAMSLAASFDLDARMHTYEEMVRALSEQRDFIADAQSEHEFVTLVLQTETRLLGENVNWFSRRAFTGVS